MSNHALAVALLKNAEGKTLVAQSRQSIRQAILTREEEYQERKMQIKALLDLARIPMKADEGCTSKAERLGKSLARLGGEDFEEGVRVLKFARCSKKEWETALFCFAS